MMRMVASIYGNTDLDEDRDAIVVILKFMKPQPPKKNIRRPHHHRYKYHCHPKATSRCATQPHHQNYYYYFHHSKNMMFHPKATSRCATQDKVGGLK